VVRFVYQSIQLTTKALNVHHITAAFPNPQNIVPIAQDQFEVVHGDESA
jgi:hypothetical protein